MNQEIKVRLATTKDLRIIQGLQVEMEHSIEENPMPDEEGRKGVDYILSKSPLHGFYLVAKINKEIIGCLRISYERSVSSNGTYWWIQNVFVSKIHRKKGVFQYLYKKVINMTSANEDIVGIKLHVHKNNLAAQKAYEKAGMKRSSEFVYIKRL